MRVEVVLTPDESKRLIAKAVICMEPVKAALKDGLVVLHPSSTTLFIMRELGYEPQGLWVCGVVRPTALCISRERQIEGKNPQAGLGGSAQDFRYSWVIERGRWLREMRCLGDLLDEMGPGDVYVKSGNAIDPGGMVGVLFAAKKAGTIALVMRKARERGFAVVLPVGLEKLIPTPVTKAAREARQTVDWAMGQPCGLIPVRGIVVTELEAIKILSGAEATPIAAGGLAGAQGAIVLSIRGEEDAVRNAVDLVKEVKGSRVPHPGPVDCRGCPRTSCHYWVEGGERCEQG